MTSKSLSNKSILFKIVIQIWHICLDVDIQLKADSFEAINVVKVKDFVKPISL